MRGRLEKKRKGKAEVRPFRSLASAYREPRLIPVGLIALDAVVGGGIPLGKFVEFFGPSKGGKTALAYEVVRAFQQAGGLRRNKMDRRGRWTDAEHAFDMSVFERVGGDPALLDYDEKTDTVEEYFESAERWIEAYEHAAVPKIEVLDSVAMLGTTHEMEIEMDRRSLDRAGQIYRGFRRLAGRLARSSTTMLFVNQVRDRVGVYFGNPETTTGGRGPEFFSTLRLRLSQGCLKKGKRALIRVGNKIVGHRIVVRVDKNRSVPAEGQAVELEWHFLTGFSATAGTLRLLADHDLVAEKTRGSEDGVEIFEFGGKKITDEEVFIDEHPDLLKSLWSPYRPERDT